METGAVGTVVQYGSFGLIVAFSLWAMKSGWPRLLKTAKDMVGAMITSQEKMWAERTEMERAFQANVLQALEGHRQALRENTIANRRAHIAQLAATMEMSDSGDADELIAKIERLIDGASGTATK